MNSTTKTILIILGSLLVLCACAGAIVFGTGIWSVGKIVQWADRSTTEDLPEVARLGAEIADYTLPDGFGSPYGVHFGDVTMIGFASQSTNTHILLTQIPKGTHIDADELLKLIGEYSHDPNSQWYSTETTLVEEKPVTIRGQETTLTIREGTSSEGITYRTAIGSFEGRGGPALALIAGPAEEWDSQMVEDFIATIQ